MCSVSAAWVGATHILKSTFRAVHIVVIHADNHSLLAAATSAAVDNNNNNDDDVRDCPLLFYLNNIIHCRHGQV